ncbi:MAG: ABC transporter ATP-binding protein [Eubacteriales bacterium]|jgi:ATP-binding cassette subfamily B protein
MNKKLKEIGRLLGNLKNAFKLGCSVSKKFFIAKIVLLISSSLFPILSAYAWREFINELIRPSRTIERIFFLLGVFCVMKIIMYLYDSLDSYVNQNYSDMIDIHRDDVFIKKCVKMRLGCFDSAELRDKFSSANDGYGAMNDIIWCAFKIVSALVSSAVAFGIIFRYNIFIAFFTVLLILPTYFYNKRYNKKRLQMNREQTRDKRMSNYYGGAFRNQAMQFELRVNDASGYFLEKFKFYRLKLFKINRREDWKNGVARSLLNLLNRASDAAVIIESVRSALGGAIEIGDIQYNMSIVSMLRTNFGELIENINQFLNYNDQINILLDFDKLSVYEESGGSLSAPGRAAALEFRDVVFSYPNTETPVLNHCSFTLTPGQKVSLVGVNGAGKSTAVKLILRLYDPDEGEILLDGKNIKEYDIAALRLYFGTLFQEQVRYSLRLREIIAFSNIKHENDDEKLKKAAENSDFAEVIKDWSGGFDTYLGHIFDPDGKELSGGQWQLLGLTRAYFQESNFMIFDEPSAALDPFAEDKIFSKLYELSKDRTALTISHRLSSAVSADKIMVLEDGRITEEGSHAELMKAGGKYSRLFAIQKERYTPE